MQVPLTQASNRLPSQDQKSQFYDAQRLFSSAWLNAVELIDQVMGCDSFAYACIDCHVKDHRQCLATRTYTEVVLVRGNISAEKKMMQVQQ